MMQEISRAAQLSELISVLLCRPDTKPGVEDILMAVDKELGERGMLEATSCLFRGCHLCMLRLPIPDANEVLLVFVLCFIL